MIHLLAGKGGSTEGLRDYLNRVVKSTPHSSGVHGQHVLEPGALQHPLRRSEQEPGAIRSVVQELSGNA